METLKPEEAAVLALLRGRLAKKVDRLEKPVTTGLSCKRLVHDA